MLFKAGVTVCAVALMVALSNVVVTNIDTSSVSDLCLGAMLVGAWLMIIDGLGSWWIR